MNILLHHLSKWHFKGKLTTVLTPLGRALSVHFFCTYARIQNACGLQRPVESGHSSLSSNTPPAPSPGITNFLQCPDLLVSELAQSCPTLQPHGLWPTRLLHLWDSPGKNTRVGCHFLLQGIFPTQGSNPGLPHCRQTLYHLRYQEAP